MLLEDRFSMFFAGKNLCENLVLESLLILRGDGQIIYRHPKTKGNASMGALMGGTWQAASSLSHFIGGGGEQDEGLRLSFDTPEKGLYMLPFQNEGEGLYMGILYRDCLNSAKFKNELRKLRDDLEEYLGKNVPLKKDHNMAMFKNITDEEIDQLFSPIGY